MGENKSMLSPILSSMILLYLRVSHTTIWVFPYKWSSYTAAPTASEWTHDQLGHLAEMMMRAMRVILVIIAIVFVYSCCHDSFSNKRILGDRESTLQETIEVPFRIVWGLICNITPI